MFITEQLITGHVHNRTHFKTDHVQNRYIHNRPCS